MHGKYPLHQQNHHNIVTEVLTTHMFVLTISQKCVPVTKWFRNMNAIGPSLIATFAEYVMHSNMISYVESLQDQTFYHVIV